MPWSHTVTTCGPIVTVTRWTELTQEAEGAPDKRVEVAAVSRGNRRLQPVKLFRRVLDQEEDRLCYQDLERETERERERERERGERERERDNPTVSSTKYS